MKQIFIFFIIISLLIFTVPGCESYHNNAAQQKEVTVYTDIPGITDEEISAIQALKAERSEFTYGACSGTEAFVTLGGKSAGFTVNFCSLLSELFDIDFVVKICDRDKLITDIDAGVIDFTGELRPTEENMQGYSMSLPIAERLLRIFTYADSDSIKTEADVDELVLGFSENFALENIIKNVYSIDFTSITADSYQMAAEMLECDEIDAFVEVAVSDTAFDEFEFVNSAIFFPMVHESVSMATANPELDPIISAVSKYISAGGYAKIQEIYREGDFEYSKNKLQSSFTSEEQQYIEDLKRRGAAVAIGIENDNYPVSFYNENEGKIEGIALDVLSEIEKLTGISFEPANSYDAVWADIYEELSVGKIAMADQLLYSNARKDDFLWSEVPYAHSFYALLSRQDMPNLASYQVGQMTVGVVKGSGKVDIYREIFPNNDNLKMYDTRIECLNALANGEIDLFMASEYNLLTETNYRERTGLKINVMLNAVLDSNFGFNKNEKILCSIIDKAQRHVDTEIIEISWTSRIFDYSRKLAEQRMTYMGSFIAALSLMLIATISVLIRDRRLSKRLKELAGKDALTDILNRRYFMELSITHIERSLRAGEESFIIIYDFDHFKSINDNYGHLAGDKVLKETAQKVKKAIRPYDLFGRYGGEEFILHISGVDKANVIIAIERIRQEICRTPVEYEGKEITISASFGISYAAPYYNIETATQYADEALYQAKRNGRNRVSFYKGE